MAIFDDLPYRAYDVLVMEPNRTEQGLYTFERLLEDYDNKVSLPMRNDPAGIAFTLQKFEWLFENRAAKIEFYKFLYRVRGRQKIFWVPTWREDVEMTADIAAGSSTVRIKKCGFSERELDTKFRHLMFIKTDGTFIYRRIEWTDYVDATAEDLVLDRPFFAGLTMANVLMVCFIALSRLDNDVIEIKHKTDMDGVATTATVFKAVWDIRDV